MKKEKLKMLLRLLICIAISFAFIYIIVFFGGWKLLESKDPILMEIAVSVIVGILLWIIYEFSRYCEKKFLDLNNKIEELEKNVEELEKRLS